MSNESALEAARSRPFSGRMWAYAKLSGPGYMQSAMTLGGGTVASCAALGSLFGYKYLWVQVLGMILGFFVLASVAKQALHTGERPYLVFKRELHPVFALIWGGSAFIATIIWHIPQYALTANGVIALAEGAGISLDHAPGRLLIGAVALGSATAMVALYLGGAKGIKAYERAVKVLVWAIVFAFAFVVVKTGVNFAALLRGILAIDFLEDIFSGRGLDEGALNPIVAGLAATVGINMIFLYPYSLLHKKWGKNHKELAYFDLVTGMAVPFIVATGLMIIAVANTIGPGAPNALGKATRDIREIIPVLAPVMGAGWARLLIGLGITAIGYSTIITHMLASGFIGCEMFGFSHEGKARFWFSLAPAIGMTGVLYGFPIPLAIMASTLAALFMPVTVACFVVLLNRRSYMGDETPRGGYRLLWNGMLTASVLIISVAGLMALRQNWAQFTGLLAPKTAHAAETASSPSEPAPESALSGGSVRVARVAMASEFEVMLYPWSEDSTPDFMIRVAEEALDAIEDLEQRISRWIPTSRASYVNAMAHAEPVRVPYDFFQMIELSLDVARQTDGAFDITVLPLIELYKDPGVQERGGPGADELEAARAKIGYEKVVLDPDNRTVRFTQEGVKLDFGGIGKGLALDVAAEVLRKYGVTSARLHGGTSTVLAIGAPPGDQGWPVTIRHPEREGDSIGVVTLRDACVSTSGCYFVEGGLNREGPCHVLDPATGRPVEGMLSASAVASTGALSDALSTAFMVMGPDKVRAYCAAHPEVKAIVVPRAPDGQSQAQWINFGPETKGQS